MRNSSSYWLAAYIISMIVILTVTVLLILNKAPDKICPVVNPPVVDVFTQGTYRP